MPGTSIKGASLSARLAYVEREHGPETLRSVLALLADEDRELLAQTILPSTKHPLELNGRLDEAIAEILDPTDPIGVFRMLGRVSAEANLSTFHKIFLGGQGPHDVLSAFPAVRSTYYSDGEATYARSGATSGVLSVGSAASHSLADCQSTAGYFQRAIELMGGNRVVVEVTHCRDRGDDDCRFACRWD